MNIIITRERVRGINFPMQVTLEEMETMFLFSCFSHSIAADKRASGAESGMACCSWKQRNTPDPDSCCLSKFASISEDHLALFLL